MDRIDEFLNRAVVKAAGIKQEMLEQLTAAYCLKTGIPPDECELVEQHTPTGMTWLFRRRGEIPEQKRVEPLATVIAKYPAEVRNDAQARREVEDIQYGSYCSCNNGQTHFAHCEKVAVMRKILDAVIPKIQKECEALDKAASQISAMKIGCWPDAEIDRIAERIVQKCFAPRLWYYQPGPDGDHDAVLKAAREQTDRANIMVPFAPLEPTCDCGPPSSFTATIRPMTEEEMAECPGAKTISPQLQFHHQPANLPVDPKRTVCVCPRELVLSRGCQCGGK